ncbi:MAG: FHA domain-containing protein [Anaerolineae bacterium]
MPVQDQLEIIYPNGEIEFHNLDLNGGIANIGRHPDNDIVIDSPGVALFHAVLDYSQKPYHITLLNQERDTTLGGQPLSPHIPAELHNWDTIEIAGHAIILLEEMDTATSQVESPPAPVPMPGVSHPASDAVEGERALAIRPSAEAAVAPLPQVWPRLSARPPDRSDSAIIIELSEREWMVNVEQVATCQVTIINGGDVVATFVVHVEGVAENWVTISPPQVNLNEGARTTVTIALTPPRHSSSRAGPHHLAVVVTSPNYLGRSSQQGVTLIVNPYYEFSVGELSPKQQTLSGRRPSGEVLVHIANKGNSEVAFRLDATDDARALNFELEVPGETTNLARQAEMRLPPEETFAVPIHITPVSRPLVGLRKRIHSFTVTAAMLEGALTPRSLLGQVKVRPLIGPWLLALFAILLVTLTIVIFRPRVIDFKAHPEDDVTIDGFINPGETVKLTWKTWPFFTRHRIEAEWIESGVTTPIFPENNARQVIEHPTQDVNYTLIAENFLSDLLPFINPAQDRESIDVFPLQPRIVAFNPDAEEIVTGQDVTLQWRVANADEVVLSYRRSDGNTGEIILDPTEYESGTRQETPLVPTTYKLCAKNKYGEDRPCEERTVTVHDPTPTPLPVPIIQSFSVTPREIYVGENVTITWEVENATKVIIIRDGIEEEKKALTGETIQTLAQLGVTKYTLRAIFEGEGHPNSPSSRDSDEEIINVREKPTPTPEPQKPVIEDFRVVPSTVVRGDGQSIQLVWSVTGETTDIGVSGPTLNLVNNLDKTGSIPVLADTTTFFILTAYNGDLSSSQTVELTISEPPPTPTPIPPPPIIDYFVLDEGSPNVTRLSSDPANDTINYEVVGGTTVDFMWSAQNVSNVTLDVDGMSLGEYPPQGGTPRLIAGAGQYQLSAENAAGVVRYAYIYISLEAVIPPPPPYGVSGQQLGSNQPLTVTWEFDPGSYAGQIDGFRIYRADTPYADYTDFTLVVDETQVSGLPPYRWPEPETGCSWAYYVRAVYKDEYGQPQVTSPSNIWQSWPCP